MKLIATIVFTLTVIIILVSGSLYLIFSEGFHTLLDTLKIIRLNTYTSWELYKTHYHVDDQPNFLQHRMLVLKYIRTDEIDETSRLANLLSFNDILHIRNLHLLFTVIKPIMIFGLCSSICISSGLSIYLHSKRKSVISCLFIAVIMVLVLTTFFLIFLRSNWRIIHELVFKDFSWVLDTYNDYVPVLFPFIYAKVFIVISLVLEIAGVIIVYGIKVRRRYKA